MLNLVTYKKNKTLPANILRKGPSLNISLITYLPNTEKFTQICINDIDSFVVLDCKPDW